jgi:hypothetical protein
MPANDLIDDHPIIAWKGNEKTDFSGFSESGFEVLLDLFPLRM